MKALLTSTIIVMTLMGGLESKAMALNWLFEDLMRSVESNQLSSERYSSACVALSSLEMHRAFVSSFQMKPDFYKGLCRANPRVVEMFLQDYPGFAATNYAVAERIQSRIEAYCDFNPSFRLCTFCHMVLADKIGQRNQSLAGVFEPCKGRLDPSHLKETPEDFESRVLAK